jgi:hypothetical protein
MKCRQDAGETSTEPLRNIMLSAFKMLVKCLSSAPKMFVKCLWDARGMSMRCSQNIAHKLEGQSESCDKKVIPAFVK